MMSHTLHAITGARPSVASSRISRSGLVISARPMVSICLSPPGSRAPAWPRPLGEPRKCAQDPFQCPITTPIDAGTRRHDQVLAHGEIGKDAAAVGDICNRASVRPFSSGSLTLLSNQADPAIRIFYIVRYMSERRELCCDASVTTPIRSLSGLRYRLESSTDLATVGTGGGVVWGELITRT